MTDIYALLNRAIDSQPDSSPETRQAVYNHIRGLYDRQRQGINPALPQEEIQAERARLAREQASLEIIIARIEAERSGMPVASDDVLAFDRYIIPEEKAETTVERADASADAGRERPRVALRQYNREHALRRRGGVIAAVVLVVIGIAAVAWFFRHESLKLKAQSDKAAMDSIVTEKITDRVNGKPAEALSQQPPEKVAGSEASEVLAQRAYLFELVDKNSGQPKISPGQVVWRVEGKGSATAVLYADVALPEAGLSFSLAMRPNSDESLPASHTIEISFDNDATAPTRAVRDISVPQLRTDKDPRGVPLVGLTIPVADNVFLIGLSNVLTDLSRNQGLLRDRDWIDIPIRFANNVIGTITFAKGSVGQQAIIDALESWQQ